MALKNVLSKVTLSTATAAALLMPVHLMADGLLGPTSTDSIAVEIIKEDWVRISAMEDVDLGAHAFLASDISYAEPFCVFASNGGYQITGSTSTADPSTFEMSAGALTLPYQVTITAAGAVDAPMTPEAAITGLTGNRVADDCNGETNAVINITVMAADFNAATPGEYIDTLTMLVEPE